MVVLPPLRPVPGLAAHLAEIDRRRFELRAELASIKPITRWTFVRGALLMLIPLAYGAALAKLFS